MGTRHSVSAPPPIYLDAQGLPHCRLCQGEELCLHHQEQVRLALNGLWTANTLAKSQRDVRYIVAMKVRGDDA